MRKNIYVYIIVLLLTVNCNNKEKTDSSNDVNILLQKFDTPFEVPPFNLIKDKHFSPAFEEAMKIHLAEINQIIKNDEEPTFENTIEAFDTCGTLLHQTINIFKAVIGTDANKERIKLVEKFFPLFSKHNTGILQNERLFRRIETVYKQKENLGLSTEQSVLLEKIYNNFVQTGVNLEPDKRKEFTEINSELASLKIKFLENLNNDYRNFKLIIDDSSDLEGLSQDMINIASEIASQNGKPGKWQFSLYKSTLIPFLKFSSKRELRKKMFKAYSKLANNNNENDNKEVVNKIINLRLQKAKLLGYENYAEYIFDADKRMLQSPEKTYSFLDSVSTIYFKKAKNEKQELQKMINDEGENFKLKAWDWAFYAEKYKKEIIKLNDNELRPYFELEKTLKGLFSAVNKMYNIKITERKDLPVYGNSIRVFEVTENTVSHTGIVYISTYAGNTNMDVIRKQYFKNNKRLDPIVYINFNFSQEYESGITFLTLKQTKNLYHEFGHALHELLSNTRYYNTSGTNVVFDFVEFPSQYLEKFALHKENLKLYAKHFKTGEIISDELIDKIQKSEQFNKGFIISERIAAAYLDMNQHTVTETKEYDINFFEKELMKKIMLPEEIIPRYKSTYFGHIFSGDYAAGYYGYIWTDILAENAFRAFNEKSIFDKETANLFRKNILEKGGSESAIELYKSFMHPELSHF